MPDGPPLTRRQNSHYRLHLAEGLEEAYAAIYTQSEPAEFEPGRELIIVYGLRFAAESAVDRRSDTSKNPRIIRVVIGPVVAVVHGDGGRCFEAVGAYLKSLANQPRALP
jgi:hypothetical protein